jgi:hypothetical protein
LLEHKFKTKELAEENVRRLAEHYKYCKEYSDYSFRTRKKDVILQEVKGKKWFTEGDLWEYSVMLTDGSKEFECHVPWVGYFESLQSLRVVPDKSEMLRIDF